MTRWIQSFATIGRQGLADRSPAGARIRRRAAAGGGLALLVLGFLLVVGLGALVLLFLALVLAAGAAPLVIFAARRARLPRIRLMGPPPIRFPRRAGHRKRALRLNARGTVYRRKGEPRLAMDAHREALAVVREAGDRPAEALTLNNLALALAHAGHDESALDHFEEALAILRELDDEQREGQVFANLGLMHGRRGRREQALGCLQVALDKLDPGSREYRRVEEQLRRAS